MTALFAALDVPQVAFAVGVCISLPATLLLWAVAAISRNRPKG